MEVSTLNYLTYLVVIIILGLLSSIVADKLKLPNILILILVGMVLTNLYYQGQRIIEFPVGFISVMALIALAMIIFDSSSKFKIRMLDRFTLPALKISLIFMFLNILILTSALNYIFQINSLLLSLIFAFLMSGTSPDAVFALVSKTSNRVMEFLQIESILNTPLVVILPFVLLDIIKTTSSQQLIMQEIAAQTIPLFQQIITGIGAGVLVGLIIFKIMRKNYSKILSPLAIIGAALLSYILAENLGGNGVLAVTTTGIFFGNVYLKEKEQVGRFSSIFTIFLEMLVFILVGLLIDIPYTEEFFIKSTLLFLIFIGIRYLTIQIQFYKSDYTHREKLFMTLTMPKGIAVATVVATLYGLTIPGTQGYIPNLSTILDLTLVFMIYTIVLATFTVHFSKIFLKENLMK